MGKQVVERKLSNKELDNELNKVKFRSAKSQKIFDEIKTQTWFRQYAKGSKAALAKITKKVRKGITHGKYSYMNVKDKEPIRGTTKETQKKIKKTTSKVVKQEKKIKQKLSRKQREIIKKTERKAPSGRKYSSTEIHEGINSKRAKEWRKKNKISEKDV